MLSRLFNTVDLFIYLREIKKNLINNFRLDINYL